ncbi:hypothetical protein MiYa_00002 [Microcystis aeruginosa NIES-2519]|uniref:site-specific DNA-methyltransferase (adenine-specific) n=1 Tax=Microcystis aeruginosa NIES-2519 TaxID=2303981 RepID=A0A5A5R1N1_MICAE|nr:TaqI-like C-terminal specificity domain-containing protein [Microcystis aeruginosa]GCA68488.1 hypothetical protein MiYa_00002 [Microcystis aeruginosa NIES-2519]
MAKLQKVGTPLGEYVKGSLYRGIITGLNEAFVIDKITRDRLISEHRSSEEVIKPFLRGRDVKRWRIDFAEQYLIKIESSENKSHPWSDKSKIEAEAIFAQTYPAIYARFQQFRDKLIKRDDQGRFFWELRSCKYWQEFEQPKIIYPNICKRNEFTFENSGYYTNQKAFIISCNDLTLLAILNSNVLMFLFEKILAKLQGNFYEPSSIFIKYFPIASATETQKQAIKYLVKQCLEAKGKEVKELEKEIDKIVYELYGLSEEEIRIIEGEIK